MNINIKYKKLTLEYFEVFHRINFVFENTKKDGQRGQVNSGPE